MPRLKARLPVGRGLLVAGNASDQEERAEMFRRRLAEIVLAVARAGGDVKRGIPSRGLEPRVPRSASVIEQLGARGVRRVGDVERPRP